MKKSAPPNYLLMSLVTFLARNFWILRFQGNKGCTSPDTTLKPSPDTTLKPNLSHTGFVLLAERLEQDSDTRPLYHSNFYLDGHYYMLFAENFKICLNSES